MASIYASLNQPACHGGGNFNPHNQRCTCPIGLNGTYCESLALPACRARRSSTAVSCAVRRPQHCACVHQCVASGAFAAHMYPVCFERISDAEPLSDVPSLLSTRATFYQLDRRTLQKQRSLPAEAALMVEHQPHLIYVSHRHCQSRCSERGACVVSKAAATHSPHQLDRARPFCKCDGFYTGRACGRHVPTLCYNNCSSRGVCLDGFCSCEPPYFGPACAYDGGALSQRAQAAGRGSPGASAHFAVHVYDLDAVVLRRHQMGSDPEAIFNTYHTFLGRLLADGPSLATSAEEADLALAPAFGTNMDGLLEYYQHAADALAHLHPHAWRERDHVWFTSGDGGGCDLNRLPALRRSIIAAHYLKLNVSAKYAAGRDSCGVPGKDLAIPPEVPPVAEAAFLERGEANAWHGA